MESVVYQHQLEDGSFSQLPVGKAVCIGRNYLDHIRELGNEIPKQALLFMKPASAMCPLDSPIAIPTSLGECHNELEMALLLDKPLRQAEPDECLDAVYAVGIGLDLTLRDVQRELKNNGQPWERAKAFDGSLPLSRFVPLAGRKLNLDALFLRLRINGEMRQSGTTAMMMRDTANLLSQMSQQFSLLPGDVILTGTPAGVGPLSPGDQVVAELDDLISVNTQVVATK